MSAASMLSDLEARAARDLAVVASAAPVNVAKPEKQSKLAWPKPQALTVKLKPEDYPLDALPEAIGDAVREVAGFVKAPLPLVASSALASLSLAAQAHIDVRRSELLEGPSGLFLLAIADSGERKTTCDGFFAKPIRDYEAQQAELAKPLLKQYDAEMSAWNAQRDGILAAVKEAGRKGASVDELRGRLIELEKVKPEAPRVPRLVYGDITPEQLGFALAHHWPSAGVISSEAGSVLGSHGMGKDSVMRNFALYNQLWDGQTVTSDRRTPGSSWTARGARFTVWLQVQELTLQTFFESSGGLARGSGFLARFLIAWPTSTMGKRPFTDPPANWPALAAFNRRLSAILALEPQVDDSGALTPPMQTMEPEARANWIAFHDLIEVRLCADGELYDVRDVASKTADNAARLAALFHQFEGGGGAISAKAFAGAARIAAWHLTESRRFFGELALPLDQANAARVDSWLMDHCHRTSTDRIHRRQVQRRGPVRKSETLTAALMYLVELDRVREAQDGKQKLIVINPALLRRGGS